MYLVTIVITSCKDAKTGYKLFNNFDNAVEYCRKKVESSFNKRTSDNHWQIRDVGFDAEVYIIEIDNPKD